MTEERQEVPGAEISEGAEAGAAQANQRRRGAKRRAALRKWLWALPVIALVLFLVVRSRRPAEVEVVRPQERLVVQTLTASGRVEGSREADLSSDRTGVLVELLVAEGDAVEAGDVIARISSEVEAAELVQAEAAVDTARAAVDEARASASALPPTIRQAEAEVQGGIQQARERLSAAQARLDELLAGGRAEEEREAEALVEGARTRLEQAEVEVGRARSLASADATARAGLERAEAAVNDAQARVQEARTRLAQAQRDLERSRSLYEQGVVAQASYEAASTAAATAADNVEQAQAALRQAQVEADRQRTLLEVTREQELDRAQTARETAQQEVRAAEARLALVLGPARAEQVAGQRAEVRSAQAALDQALRAGPARVESVRRTPADERVQVAERQLAQAQAARDTVLARLEKTAVGTQFPGIVTDLILEPGDVVTPGQAIVTIAAMDSPEIELEIDEREIAEVRVGQDAFYIADAYPDLTAEATVDRIAPQAITERGVIGVTLRPLDPPEWLRPGMTVDASVVIEGRRELLVLPVGVVEQSGDQHSVLVVDGGVVRRLQVEPGVGGVRGTIIRNGLPADALVVLEPTSVEVGQRVDPVEAESAEEEPDV